MDNLALNRIDCYLLHPVSPKITGHWLPDPIRSRGGKPMSAPGVATPTEYAEPPKSFLERFIGVFISPTETFADIGRKPDFVAPLVVGIVGAVAITETMLAKIGMGRIVRASLEPRAQQSGVFLVTRYFQAPHGSRQLCRYLLSLVDDSPRDRTLGSFREKGESTNNSHVLCWPPRDFASGPDGDRHAQLVREFDPSKMTNRPKGNEAEAVIPHFNSESRSDIS